MIELAIWLSAESRIQEQHALGINKELHCAFDEQILKKNL